MKRRSFIAAAVAALVAPKSPAITRLAPVASPFAGFVGIPGAFVLPDLRGQFLGPVDVYESNFGEGVQIGDLLDSRHLGRVDWHPAGNEHWRGMVLYKDGAA